MTTQDTKAPKLTDAQAAILDKRGDEVIPKFHDALKKDGYSDQDIQAMQDKFDADDSPEKHALQAKMYDDIWEKRTDAFISKFKGYHGIDTKKTENEVNTTAEKPNFMQVSNLNMSKDPKAPPSETSNNKPSTSKTTSTGDPMADRMAGWN